MANSPNVILVPLIFLSCSILTGLSQRGSEVTKMLPCMELMMPCQNYLNDPKPPESCCEPFRYVHTHNPECLCSIIFNDDMLYYLNVSFEDAVSFAFKCDTTPLDVSTCTFMQIPTINVDRSDSQLSTSHAGSSTYHVGFRRILTFAVATILVTSIPSFVQASNILYGELE